MFTPINRFLFSIIILFIPCLLGAMEIKRPMSRRSLRVVAWAPCKQPQRAARRRAVAALLDSSFTCEMIDTVMQYEDTAFSGQCVKKIDAKCCASALAVLSNDLVAIGTETGEIRIIPLTGQACRELQVLDAQLQDPLREPVVTLVPLSTGFISLSDAPMAKYWQQQQDQYMCVNRWCGGVLGPPPTTLAVVPKDRFATGLADGEIKVWAPADGCTSAVSLNEHNSMVVALGILANGLLVSASKYDINIWKPIGDTYQLRQKVTGHAGDITAMVVLPGNKFATGARDKTIKVWADNGRDGFVCEQTLKGHKGAIRALAVVYDGSLISIADDELMHMWCSDRGSYYLFNTVAASKLHPFWVGNFSCLAATCLGLVAVDEGGYLYVFE